MFLFPPPKKHSEGMSYEPLISKTVFLLPEKCELSWLNIEF